MTKRFTNWAHWDDRATLQGISEPGVYALAVSRRDLSGSRFTWLEEIAYFGMTNSCNGLIGRLKQFDRTIGGKEGHGGAARFRRKYANYDALSRRLFVAIKAFPCKPSSPGPDDLRIMGIVAQEEYHCLARFVELYARLPEFNDKKRSPKV